MFFCVISNSVITKRALPDEAIPLRMTERKGGVNGLLYPVRGTQ